jgi:hypothetical protein
LPQDNNALAPSLARKRKEREREREREDYTKNSFFSFFKQDLNAGLNFSRSMSLTRIYSTQKKKKPFIQSPSKRLVTNKAAKYQNNNDTTHSY